MKSVLFVDDEPKILAGLKRMLRGMRHDWRMDFVSGGAEALESMGREPFDIVVSDMKMPGMDGAELLSEVQRVWPGTVRIILSGHASRVSMLKAVGPTQQYLAKPCDPESLKTAIERAWRLRALVPEATVRGWVGNVDTLPSPSPLFQAVTEQLRSPDVSHERLSQVIGQDVGMTAKILQLANSSYFGTTRRIRSVEAAVAHLGVEAIHTLVFSGHIFAACRGSHVAGFSLESLRRHSHLTSKFAAAIAREEEADDRLLEDSAAAAMLHDVGKLLLSDEAPQHYEQIVEHRHSAETERRETEASHAAIGAYLLGLWGFPDEVLHAIEHHSTPRECPEPGFGTVVIVHVANALAREFAAEVGRPARPVDVEHLKALDFEHRLPVWREACRRSFAQHSEREVRVGEVHDEEEDPVRR